MLKDFDAVAIIAVSDTERARVFYTDVLGLDAPEDGPGGSLAFKTGGVTLLVYPSEFAGTNKANAVVFGVEGIEAIVAALQAKGAAFATYPAMGMTMDGPIHVSGEVKLVWVKDPDGNLIHLNQGMG
ncbi:glyoxalase [Brevundimonas sp. Leaf363]|uniref:VOC family protein n=1 Tax=Brevundimonas sp. Leaf363 TaxID=1736353 RepID=UPI0006FAFAE8|nr:VOC family protein [Brevundimonas sp. Leaf363]KQS53729.1 glyoxalase [Brevundimonas sp. Leaf363]